MFCIITEFHAVLSQVWHLFPWQRKFNKKNPIMILKQQNCNCCQTFCFRKHYQTPLIWSICQADVLYLRTIQFINILIMFESFNWFISVAWFLWADRFILFMQDGNGNRLEDKTPSEVPCWLKTVKRVN